jgi:predicted permease
MANNSLCCPLRIYSKFNILHYHNLIKGTAFGILTSILNLYLGIIPMFNAHLLTEFGGYDQVNSILISHPYLTPIDFLLFYRSRSIFTAPNHNSYLRRFFKRSQFKLQ